MDSFKNLFWIHYNIASVLCSDFWPWGMWNLSSSTRYWICTPCIRRWSLNHWTIRKVYSCRVSEIMFYTTLILCNLSTIELSSNKFGKFGVKKVQREYFLQYSQSVMEKAMATHSSTLAWKIPWTEEPGRLQSMGSLRVGHSEPLHFHFSLSRIGEGNGNPLQCSCPENPKDREAWWAAVYGISQSHNDWSDLAAAAAESVMLKCIMFQKWGSYSCLQTLFEKQFMGLVSQRTCLWKMLSWRQDSVL